MNDAEEDQMNDTEVPTLEDVMLFTAESHVGQYRKNGLPYMVHPMAVVSMLGYWEIKCPKTLKGGSGHDIREERPDITFDVMVRRCGREEAIIIEELSFFPVPGAGPDHIQKKAYMSTWMVKSVEALVIKFADRCCNTIDFMASDPNYARKYWTKASDLIDAMITRGDEIVARYGVATFAKMKYTKQRVEDDLALFSPTVR